MRSIDRRIRKLESVANLEEAMRQYVDDHGNVMAKPTDPLQVLAWVIQHPLARLDLIANTANRLAQYMYARKQHATAEIVDVEARNQCILKGRERVAQAKRLRELGKERLVIDVPKEPE
jgi:hypothetical protein